jgi:hypothetical protein
MGFFINMIPVILTHTVIKQNKFYFRFTYLL